MAKENTAASKNIIHLYTNPVPKGTLLFRKMIPKVNVWGFAGHQALKFPTKWEIEGHIQSSERLNAPEHT